LSVEEGTMPPDHVLVVFQLPVCTDTMGKQFMSFEAAAMMRKNEEKTIVLTRREKEVLELVGEGLTNGEIADKLFIGITTVISHRKNILEKFKVNNTAVLIKKAFEGGYIGQ